MSTPNKQAGFTLMEVIVAVAIVAIMAGGIAPVIYKQVNAARSHRTSDEQGFIKEALLAFYDDVGRFPSESEGLQALVVDPGVSTWAGPYLQTVQENPAVAVQTDAFGQNYIYDLNPTTIPANAATILVASGGINLQIDCGGLNANWDLTDMQDDLVALVSSGPIDRANTSEVQAEFEALADACRAYYADNMAFPASLGVLQGSYLDPGYAATAFTDPWNNSYALYLFAGTPQIQLRIYSFGPNQTDNNGAGDDLSVVISSIPVAREKSLQEIAVSQSTLDATPSLVLTGDWSTDRVALGLPAAFDLDGWGTRYGVNPAIRLVYSAGSDGNPVTITDNVPVGFGP